MNVLAHILLALAFIWIPPIVLGAWALGLALLNKVWPDPIDREWKSYLDAFRRLNGRTR